MILWLTLLGLCDQLDEAFHRLNLLGFAIVELWIMALVDGRAKLLRPPPAPSSDHLGVVPILTKRCRLSRR